MRREGGWGDTVKRSQNSAQTYSLRPQEPEGQDDLSPRPARATIQEIQRQESGVEEQGGGDRGKKASNLLYQYDDYS